MNEEIDVKESKHHTKPRLPPVTGYSLIVTIAAVVFGAAKAIPSYQGMSTQPAAIEWVHGVLVTVWYVVLA